MERTTPFRINCLLCLLVALLLAGCAHQQRYPNLPRSVSDAKETSDSYPANRELMGKLANEYFNHGMYEEAAEAYKNSGGGDSSISEPNSWFYAAVSYRMARKFDAAIAAQKRAIALKPDDDRYYQHLAKIYLDNGNHNEAITAAKHAISINPANAVAHNLAGAAYGEKVQYTDAISHFKKAIELDPKDTANYLWMGHIFIEQDRPADALPMYSKAMESSPESVAAIHGTSRSFYFMGRYDEAIVHATRAIEASKISGIGIAVTGGGAGGRYPMVASFVAGGPGAKAGLKKGDVVTYVNGQSTENWGKDISKFAQAVRGPAGTEVSLTIVGTEGKVDKTIIRESIQQKETAKYYAHRSHCYIVKGEATKAMDDARAALAIDPKNDTAINAFAAVLIQQGQHEQALQHLQAPSSDRAKLLKATALARLSRGKEAAEVYAGVDQDEISAPLPPYAIYRKAFFDAIRPYVTEARDRAKALEARGQYQEALSSYADALKAADPSDAKEISSACFSIVRKSPALGQVPEEARRYAIRSEALVKQGDFAGGLVEIKKAIDESPFIGQFHYNAALIQAELKQYRGAIGSMNLFLASAPDSPHARAARDEIIKWELMIEKGK